MHGHPAWLPTRKPSSDSSLKLTFHETCVLLTVSCRTGRYCSEDCVLNGVQFMKGSLVLLAIDTIHHDPNVWTDPEEFNPDRY